MIPARYSLLYFTRFIYSQLLFMPKLYSSASQANLYFRCTCRLLLDSRFSPLAISYSPLATLLYLYHTYLIILHIAHSSASKSSTSRHSQYTQLVTRYSLLVTRYSALLVSYAHISISCLNVRQFTTPALLATFHCLLVTLNLQLATCLFANLLYSFCAINFM